MSLKAFPERVQWGGRQSRTKGYFLERGRVVTNYEQLITLRWHFVEQRNTIKHGGCISGGWLEGANSSLSMTKRITLDFPEDLNLINKCIQDFGIFFMVFPLFWTHTVEIHFENTENNRRRRVSVRWCYLRKFSSTYYKIAVSCHLFGGLLAKISHYLHCSPCFPLHGQFQWAVKVEACRLHTNDLFPS